MKVRVPRSMRGGLRTLLGSLIVFLVLFPLLDEGLVGRAAIVIISTVIALSGAYAVSRDRRRLAMALLLAMPTVATRWGMVVVPTPAMRGAALASSIVFFVFTILLILDYVLRTDEVTGDEIYGAVSVYILMGFAWGMAYGLLDLVQPGSIRSVGGPLVPGDYFYFSFITLMTVGYGDMYPAGPVARSLAIVEAMVGVIFIAVLIGRLVGLRAGRTRRT